MVDCEGVSLGSSCAKLPHSRSAEISKTPPPGSGPKSAGKMLSIRVHMLDGNVTLFQVQAKALGRVLFEQVCKQLHLLEADYFGLEYQDHSGTRYWLDLEKQLSRQVGLSMVDPLLHFCVKFYTPDPAQLEEEFTRYLFCLQVKRDLAQGHIQCNDNTAALMASYIVQAECGDYSSDDYPDHSYLSSYNFVPHQDSELEKKIMENHKKHTGQSPAEADLNLLETARRCELYGMKMHPVKDHEGVPLNLAVAHMGIVVFQNYTKIYTFSWAKVRKISFKRKKFLIKLHPDGYGYYKDIVEFFFESRNECKNLWKKCVENHGFFRCNSVKRTPRQRTRVLSRGSSFRYSGKTQKQMVEFVRENYVKRQNFQRSQSFRQSNSVHSSVATNVGGSISAHPLIPLGDNSIVSASCGSMVLAAAEEASQNRTFPETTRTKTTAQTGPRRSSQEVLLHSTSIGTSNITSTNITTSTISTNTPATQPPGLRSYNTTSSQTDITDLVEDEVEGDESATGYYSWQRSASARELRKTEVIVAEAGAERRSDRSFAIAGSKTPSFDRDQDSRVYSSSYPGTVSSLSSEELVEMGGSVLVIDTGSSHDDLSQDSYELLERELRQERGLHSRTCSIGSSSGDNIVRGDDDEMFIMDNDDISETLSSYVEPRYRDISFNEFNEKCKEGIARFRERNVEFAEFDAKCKPGTVIGYDEPSPTHYPVERTKSEPFVSDFWKVARQHRKLFHQKSFDYTPIDSVSSEERSAASKSAADIPYTLHKREQMNGTANPPFHECRAPVRREEKRSTKGSHQILVKTKQDSDLNSQDSGLSLSLGAESVDDLVKPQDKYVKKDLLKVCSEDGPRAKGTLVKCKALSADSALRKSFERNPPIEVIKIPSEDGEGIVICSSEDQNISVDTTDPDVIIVEYHTKRKRAFQKRSSSGGSLKLESGTNPVAKTKEWKSESSSSCDLGRERFSKETKTSIEGKVVRADKEVRKQRSEESVKKTEDLKKKNEELRKHKSEDLDEKRSERRQEMMEALKKKHEDLNKIEILKPVPPPKPANLTIEIPKETPRVEVDLKTPKTEKIVMQVPVEINATESQLNNAYEIESPNSDKLMEIKEEKEEEPPEPPKKPDKLTSPELWKRFGELPPVSTKRERSPVLFARLGFSEGSTFSPTHNLSPSSTRRAKSLDAPVVSLQRLPPITSFSSRDDTVDNEEGIELEEKALKRPIAIEEEDTSTLSPLVQDANRFVTLLPESDATQVLTKDESESAVGCPTVEPLLKEYSVEPLPVTQFYPEDTLQPERAKLSTLTQLSDEQKVPVDQTFDGDGRTSEGDDESYNDVFETSAAAAQTVPEGDSAEEVFDDSSEEPPVIERRPSTRQERLDSFKNTKSYSVDIWTSEETDGPCVPTVNVDEIDFEDDDAFAPTDTIEALIEQISPKEKIFPEYEVVDLKGEIMIVPPPPPLDDDVEIISPPPIESFLPESDEMLQLSASEVLDPVPDPKTVPNKRSFDDDASSSSSLRPEKPTLKPFSLESSGSSSLEEGIFPPDDCSHFADEEEGSSNSAKDEYQGFGYSVAGAELVIGGYTGVFGLSRTLSRISERSTTSEQERSDFDDDLSTKPSSRSMSAEDESLMSSDRQPSLSSDPSTNPEELSIPLPPLPAEPLGFTIPPPLLRPDEEWPSPPNSTFDTPVIGNVGTFFMDPPEEQKPFLREIRYERSTSSEDSDYENKTLQEDDGHDSSTKESTVKQANKRKQGNSSDTSLGISDFSSSTTGTTVKHCTTYYSCTVKSDDSSLADFGSLSTEMLASSRKNSDDSMTLRRRSYHTPQRSFDDYDSPCTESDDGKPPKRNYVNLPSPTGRKTPKTERRCSAGATSSSSGKSIARSKCYSYYSLARSPPSDGSSSSLEMGEPPAAPNTIPRVSKRRRAPPAKRRFRPADQDRDGRISSSSPSVVGLSKRAQPPPLPTRSQISKQSSV